MKQFVKLPTILYEFFFQIIGIKANLSSIKFLGSFFSTNYFSPYYFENDFCLFCFMENLFSSLREQLDNWQK